MPLRVEFGITDGTGVIAVLFSVPMTVGDAKDPLASDNSAVRVFPLPNIISDVNGTFKITLAFGDTQNGDPVIVDVLSTEPLVTMISTSLLHTSSLY